MKRNVLMIAPFNTRSGYGDHARSIYYSIMDREDLDIKCIDVKWGNTPRNHLKSEIPRHKKLLDSFVAHDKVQGQPDVLIDIRIPNEFATGAKLNIGITAGVETDVVSPEFLDGMNRMNFNIVPSRFTADTFNRCTYDRMEDLPNGQKRKSGEVRNEKPIHVLFEGVDTDVYYPKQKHQLEKELCSELDELIKEDFAYLHVGQWGNNKFGEDRKNIGVLVKSFLKAFANIQNPPALVLKTNGANYSVLDREECMNKVKSIKAKFPKDIKLPNIYILHGELTQEELNYLYNHPKIKSMVSFTHGEGFGRPLLEASMVGLPVITSAWSGPLDFLHKDESILLGGTMEKVPPAAVWEDIIIPESQWFVVDETNARNALDHMYQNHSSWKRAAGDLMEKNRDRFKLSDMTTRLGEIMDRNTAELPVEKTFNQLPVLETIED